VKELPFSTFRFFQIMVVHYNGMLLFQASSFQQTAQAAVQKIIITKILQSAAISVIKEK